MADNVYVPITFIDAHDKGFYFSLGENDLVEDKFKDSEQCLIHMLQSNDDKILTLSDDKRYEAKQLTKKEQEQHECKFNIHIYEKEFTNSRPGRTVLLYVNKDGKKMVVCCNENNDIYPKEMDIPQEIDQNNFNTLFNLTKLKGIDKFKFESVAYPQRFLGFEPVKDNDHINKLVLRGVGKDEPDECSEILLT